MNHRSLAFRLSVWYALLLSATFTLVAGGLYYGIDRYLRAGLSDSLQRRSQQVVQILLQAPTGASAAAIGDEIETRVAPEFNSRFVRVTRAPATLVYRSGSPADRSFDPAGIPPASADWTAGSAAPAMSTGGGRLVLSSTPVVAASGRYLVELGAALGPVEAVERRLLGLLAVLLPALVICATGGGYVLVQRALRPVDLMSGTAERISVQDLNARLPVLSTGDALQRLSISLNQMLARLSDSVQSSRRFLADASHELRTPLTVIKGELQQLAADTPGSASVAERLGSVLEEVTRLEHLVSGLLTLSRLDAGDAQRASTPIDLSGLVAATVEQMHLVAEDRGVTLQTWAQAGVTVRGDAARLRQVVVNLLDNAIKFTPGGGLVRLHTGRSADAAILEVSDTGIGISADHLPHVFNRFYRVDAARAREPGGAGLGLAIVRSICAAHGAEIEVDSAPGRGSRFRLRFPLAAGARLEPTAVSRSQI